MAEKKFVSHSEQETRELGRTVGEAITSGLVVLLYGDLGTGKTVFVRGVGEALGISGVRSPSFTLINEYESPSGIYIIHADLYRLDTEGVYSLGLNEYIGASDSVLFVEWPERWRISAPDDVLTVKFTALSEDEREIIFSAQGVKALEVLNRL